MMMGTLLLSICYFKERVIFSDASFYLFILVKETHFAIFHFRFVAILTQILPLIARFFELPLYTISLLFSISFPLVSILLFLWCNRIDKSGSYMLVMVLSPMLFTTGTFFWITSEMTQGIMLCALFFAIQNVSKSPIKWHLLLLPIIVFSHLWAMMAFCFWVVFLFLHKVLKRRQAVMLLIICLTLVLLKTIFFQEPYDWSSLGGIKNFISLFPNYFTTHAFTAFIHLLPTQYYWVVILLFVNIRHYILSRNYLKLSLMLFAFSVSLLLVNVCFPSNSTPGYYLENLYQPIAVFLFVPFVFDVIITWSENLKRAIILLVIISAFIRIMTAYPIYHERLSFLEKTYKEVGNAKAIIPNNSYWKSKLYDTWATPFEFWMIASFECQKTPSIIITDSIGKMQHEGSHAKVFLLTWNGTPYADYPKKYFQFEDTISVYQLMEKR